METQKREKPDAKTALNVFDHIYFDLLNFVGGIPVHYSISVGIVPCKRK